MSKLYCCFFGNPTNKTVTRCVYTWELLIANHLDHSLWSTNQKHWAAVRSNLLHFFLKVHNCVAPSTSRSKLHEFAAGKPIFLAKLTHFEIFAINFTVWNHILSTVGDALSHCPSQANCSVVSVFQLGSKLLHNISDNQLT
jgi:hypothetical protein